jgi:hypothetical protein
MSSQVRNRTSHKRHRRHKIPVSFLCLLCLLWLITPSKAHETLTTTVLFDREIVRILDRHCVMCHAENGPSFPLETYEQTWLRGRKVRSEVIARHMPPWAAVPGYGQFINDNSLTLRETQFMVSWVEGLGPRNSGTVFTNVADATGPRPAVRAKADFGHWQLGPPALMRQIEGNIIEPGQGNLIKRTVVDLGLSAERRLRGLEYMPGDRHAVSAAFFTIQETGQWIGSWTPWFGFVEAAPNSAYRLAAGAHVVAEIHYGNVKGHFVDRGTLGLYFADKPAPNTISDIVLDAKTAARPERFHAELTLPADTHALAIRIEPAPETKSVEVDERKIDGETQVLLFAKDIPEDWPTPYIFKNPVLLHRGSVLSVTSHSGPVKVTVSRY